MQQYIQVGPVNVLELWPHTNLLMLTEIRWELVTFPCMPSIIWQNVFVDLLIMHITIPLNFFCANNFQIRPLLWTGCCNFWRWLLMMWQWEDTGWSQVTKCPPLPIQIFEVSIQERLIYVNIIDHWEFLFCQLRWFGKSDIFILCNSCIKTPQDKL